MHAARLDGGGSTALEVGARVELRLDRPDGQACVQLQADGSARTAPRGARGTAFVLQTDGAAAGAPPWADPRCVGFGRLPAAAGWLPVVTGKLP